MSRVIKLSFLPLLIASAATAFAAGDGSGVSPRAAPLFFGDFITNSILTGWVFSAIVVVLILKMIGKPSIVPSKGQAVMESLITGLRELFEPIVGKKAFPAAFPILVTLFIFILTNNWMGLLPGVGTIGWGVGEHWWNLEHLNKPLIRPFTSDFNGTIALALLSFGAWFILVMKYAGPKVLFLDLFGNKAEKKETPGWLYPVLTLVFLVVGCIEVFSIIIRPFTLSVRLFGNVFGGENLLHGTSFFFIFYFMEMLVGLIQAVVFTLLTSVYIGLICNHGDDHEDEHAAAH
jgi:F-type H+-transporting ATPase subunit a